MIVKDGILFSLRYYSKCKQKGLTNSMGSALLALSLGEQTIEEIAERVNNSKDGMNCVMRQVKAHNLAAVAKVEKKDRAIVRTWALTTQGEKLFSQLITK